MLTLPRARLGRCGIGNKEGRKWARRKPEDRLGCCTHRVMTRSTEPIWQLIAVELLEGLELMAWIIGHTLRKFSETTKGRGGKHLTPKRQQLLLRSGEVGRQVHSPDGITSEGNRTCQGTAGLYGSSFVEREVELLVTQELSRGHCCAATEVSYTLSCVTRRQAAHQGSEIPLVWPFWDCFGNPGSSLGLPSTKPALTDGSRPSRAHQWMAEAQGEAKPAGSVHPGGE